MLSRLALLLMGIWLCVIAVLVLRKGVDDVASGITIVGVIVLAFLAFGVARMRSPAARQVFAVNLGALVLALLAADAFIGSAIDPSHSGARIWPAETIWTPVGRGARRWRP